MLFRYDTCVVYHTSHRFSAASRQRVSQFERFRSLRLQTKYAGSHLEYILPIIIFIGCAGVALALTLILMMVDLKRNDGVLNSHGGTHSLLHPVYINSKERLTSHSKQKLSRHSREPLMAKLELPALTLPATTGKKK